MAYTAGAITTQVQTRIRDTGFSSSTVLDLINDAQNDVCNEYRFPFMQTFQNYTLTADDEDITSGSGLPAAFVQALNLTVTSSGYERVIPIVSYDEVDENFPDPTDTTRHPANVPQVGYYADGTLNVYPVPNTAYTVKLTYYKKPTLLTADGDVPEIPSEFQEILVLGAAFRALQIKDNYDQAGILQNAYDEKLQKLAVKYNQVQVGTPNRIRINRRGMGKTNF